MRKRKKGKKLNRDRSQRKALIKALVTALVLQERITTTLAKAKEAARFTEKFITLAKKGDLASRRILAGVFSHKTAQKLIAELAPRYKERHGGYTRIIKLGQRKSDAAKMAVIELVK